MHIATIVAIYCSASTMLSLLVLVFRKPFLRTLLILFASALLAACQSNDLLEGPSVFASMRISGES